MIKQERKALRLIKKHFGFSEIIFLDPDKKKFLCDKIEVSYKNEDIPLIIRSLANQGYLKLSNHPTSIYFGLTYEGYNRFKFLMDSFKIAFLTKWLPGFISGVVTTVVTEWLIRSIL